NRQDDLLALRAGLIQVDAPRELHVQARGRGTLVEDGSAFGNAANPARADNRFEVRRGQVLKVAHAAQAAGEAFELRHGWLSPGRQAMRLLYSKHRPSDIRHPGLCISAWTAITLNKSQCLRVTLVIGCTKDNLSPGETLCAKTRWEAF